MIKIFSRCALLAAAASSLSACAPIISGAMNASVDEQSLKTKTADYLGVPPETVTISSMDKGALATAYQAQYQDKRYRCTIYYGKVDCRQLESLASGAAPDHRSVAIAAQPLQQPAMTTVQAQTRLNQLGFSVGNPDGVFGKKTVQQLKAFQESRDLPRTGKLDPATVDALR